MRAVEFELLSDALNRALGDGATSRVSSDGMVYVEGADGDWVTELSGNTVHPRAVSRWYPIKAGLGDALGIPYVRRHEIVAEDLDSTQLMLDASGRSWELRGLDADGKPIRRLIKVPQDLAATVEDLASSRRLFIEECTQPARCTVLARGTEILGRLLVVPFGVRGDGVRSLDSLVSAQLDLRAANPLAHLANSTLTQADSVIAASPMEADAVIEAGSWVPLSDSAAFGDGALTVGLGEPLWPELEDYVGRVARVTGGPGLMSMTFGLRNDEAGTHWAWLSSSSEPRLAQFLYPHLGSSYDGFDEHAKFLLSRPRKLL